MRFAIVVPCFNEAERIDSVAFSTFISKYPEITFCFVDDGSSDNTLNVLYKIVENTDSCVLALAHNCGKAEAVRRGLLHALEKYPETEWFGFWDADLATPLEEMFNFESYLTPDVLMLIGCRHQRLGTDIKRKAFRHYLGRVFATAASIHLDLEVYDTQCGAKIIKREIISNLFGRKFVTRWFFDVEILRRCIAYYSHDDVKKRVVEVPLKKWVDAEDSKVKLVRCVWDFIKLLNSKN